MQVNSARLKELRNTRQWSQEQLSQLSGLNLRTTNCSFKPSPLRSPA